MSAAGTNRVRLGIVGLGHIGTVYAGHLLHGRVPRGELAAVCTRTPERLAPYTCARFTDAEALFASGAVDAVLIATPHPAHVPLAHAALDRGLHVLLDKPLGVHKAEVERLLAAHPGPRPVFAAMFNQRTDDFYRQVRRLVRGGDLGRLQRFQWTSTAWFRTARYYASSPWRATWAGEGGGVLLNQAPHVLDLLCWIFGLPARVRAFCHLGKYHRIEVEDEVTAYLEYADGLTGTFLTGTGEAPGTNRLEIAGDLGRVVLEDDEIVWTRNLGSARRFSETSAGEFEAPAMRQLTVPAAGHGGQQAEVMANFVDAILDGAPLIAPAAEGLASLELANAMLYSSARAQTVELPLDAAAYERFLAGLQRAGG